MNMIYTDQKSRLTKKQAATRKRILAEQTSIRKKVYSVSKAEYKPQKTYALSRIEENKIYLSREDSIGILPRKETMQYSGTVVIGIGQMHKSNAVPVTSQTDAVSIARMRR
jgi:hypothetical protein